MLECIAASMTYIGDIQVAMNDIVCGPASLRITGATCVTCTSSCIHVQTPRWGVTRRSVHVHGACGNNAVDHAPDRRTKARDSNGSKNPQVALHRRVQPRVQRFPDQRMADRDLLHIGHRMQKVTEIFLTEVVACIHA